MNPSSLELLRHCILRQLAAALPASLTADTLFIGLTTAGFSLTAEDLSRELLYLSQKNLLEVFTKTVSPTPRYRITAQGRDYLQSEGL